MGVTNNHYHYKPPLIDAAIQAEIAMTDNWTQTITDDNKPYQHNPPGVIGSGYHNAVNFNHYYGFSNHITPPMNNNDGRPPYVQEMQQQSVAQVFQPPWPQNTYNYQAADQSDLGRSGWLDVLSQLSCNGPIITAVSREVSPITSPAIQDSIPLEENGLNSYEKHSDVLDEREDMAIERSLVAEEKQQSYAAALKEKQMASGNIDTKCQHLFVSIKRVDFI